VDSEQLNYSSRSEESRMLAQFLTYRAYYSLGLIHFAHSGWINLLSQPRIVRYKDFLLASLNCLNKIHRDYPAVALDQKILGNLSQLSPASLTLDQKQTLWQGTATLAAEKFLQKGTLPTIETELTLLKGSNFYENLIRALDSTKKADYPSAIRISQELIKDGAIPKPFESQLDGLSLNLGRILYEESKFDQSLSIISKMRRDVNTYAAGLQLRAWNQLRAKRYGDAVATAMNFKVGELRDIFAPEVDWILAISFFENCRYRQASTVFDISKRNINLPTKHSISGMGFKRNLQTELP
jgi:hypothetical protein